MNNKSILINYLKSILKLFLKKGTKRYLILEKIHLKIKNKFTSLIYWKKKKSVSSKSIIEIENIYNSLTYDNKYKIWYKYSYPSEDFIFPQNDNSKLNINPINILLVITNFNNIHQLNNTLNSIYRQSYVLWQCVIIGEKEEFDKINLEQKAKLKEVFRGKNIKFINSLYDVEFPTEIEVKYFGFLESGEILNPNCLKEYINANKNNVELIYSDHDYIEPYNKNHIKPWFTFKWSPDLLLCQNYIGGFFLISSFLFFKILKEKKIENSIITINTLAWRYGILVNCIDKVKKVVRIPHILWTSQIKSSDLIIKNFKEECNEIKQYLNKKNIAAEILEHENLNLRYIKWDLEKKPVVSIIIPTTGNIDYLKRCLDSIIEKTEYENYEIIILDNGRGAFPEGILYAKNIGIKVIKNIEPFNWSRLNNIGVNNSSGELLLFLNDDTEVIEKKWLTEMVRQVVRKDIGTVGSLLLYPEGLIQHAGVFLVDHGGGARHHFYKQEATKNYQNLDLCVREVSANTGACLMISRENFIKIGRFDETLSLVGNDIDLCLRCIENGLKNIWTPESKLIHHESISRKNAPIEEGEKAMWKRWSSYFLSGDYYYNPNLTLEKEDFSIPDNPQLFFKFSKEILLEGQNIDKLNKFNFGVNYIAYIRAEMGLGEAARGNAIALESANIPFGIINYEKGNKANMGDLSLQYKEIKSPNYNINLIHINADHTKDVFQTLEVEFFNNKYNIGFWAWELPEFPDRWIECFDYFNEIWVPSTFVNDAISIKSSVPIITIPHVVDANFLKTNDSFNKSYFGIKENSFVFLSMFDTNSIAIRKNPYGSIIAFKKAFLYNDKTVLLLIKVNRGNKSTYSELKEFIGEYQNIKIIDRQMTKIEINSLISQIDCYVSLHRSEGFGLAPAEAMAFGKVAILTNWSGNTQYMTNNNCIPINYDLIQIGESYGPYEAHQYWASPDIEQASHEMVNLVKTPELVRTIGINAKITIAKELSAKKIGDLMKQRLTAIEMFFKNTNIY